MGFSQVYGPFFVIGNRMQISIGLILGVVIGVGILVMLVSVARTFLRRMRSRDMNGGTSVGEGTASGGTASGGAASGGAASGETASGETGAGGETPKANGPLLGTYIASNTSTLSKAQSRAVFSLSGTTPMLEISMKEEGGSVWRTGLKGPYSVTLRNAATGKSAGTFTSTVGPRTNAIPFAYQVIPSGVTIWMWGEPETYISAQ